LKSADHRLAYANGLHRNSTVQRNDGIALSFIEIEERRRVFWSIYYLDTFLSLLLGRPPSISDSDLDAEPPESIQDSRITADTILPEAMEAETEQYLYGSLRTLCLQLRKIYDELYSTSSSKGQTQSTLIASITSLDEDLANWRANLPAEHMPFQSGADTQNLVHVPSEKAYFSLAYYFCLCLVHRPALVQLLQATNEDIPPQRSPRRGKSPARTVNPRLTGSTGFEQNADRCVIAARDLLHLIHSGSVFVHNQLSYLHCSADLMVFRLLPPCTITAGSIIVDNLVREPHGTAAEDDLRLLQNVKQAIEASIDNALARPLIDALNELERIALRALRPDAPPQLAQIPETQSPAFFPPGPSSQSWHLYTPQDEAYVAGPIGYEMPYQEQTATSSALYQQPTSVMSSYAQTQSQLSYPFQPAQSSATTMSHMSQHMPSPPTIIQHPHDIHSPYQQTSLPWGQNSNTGLTHPIMQPPSQQQYPYPGQQWISNVPNPSPQSPTRPHRGGHKKSPSRSSRGRGAR